MKKCKRLMALLLCSIMTLTLAACNSNSSAENPEEESESMQVETESPSEDDLPEEESESMQVETESPSEDDLIAAIKSLSESYDLIDSVATQLLSDWSTSSWYVDYFLDEDEFDAKVEEGRVTSDLKSHVDAVNKNRIAAKKNIDEAKSLIGTNGSGDFYNAVKDYYLNVKAYYDFVSEYPEGYSKLTYSSTVSDIKEKCNSSYNELEFFAE